MSWKGSTAIDEPAVGPTAARLLPLCDKWTAAGRISGCDSPATTMPTEEAQRARFAALSTLPWAAAAAALVDEARSEGMDERFFAPFLDAVGRYGDFEAVRIPPDATRFGALGAPRTTIFFADASAAPAMAAAIRERLSGFPTRIASIALVSADLGHIISEDFGRAVWLVSGIPHHSSKPWWVGSRRPSQSAPPTSRTVVKPCSRHWAPRRTSSTTGTAEHRLRWSRPTPPRGHTPAVLRPSRTA